MLLRFPRRFATVYPACIKFIVVGKVHTMTFRIFCVAHMTTRRGEAQLNVLTHHATTQYVARIYARGNWGVCINANLGGSA